MKKIFYFFILAIIALQTLANNTIDPDYWARLLQGNAFWQTGSIMKQDIFSYTPTHFWLDHEWGSSVVFSFIQNHFGFPGILTAKILLVFCIFFLIFKTIRLANCKHPDGTITDCNTGADNNLLNVILFLSAFFAMPTITQSGFRCHFFTFFFFTLFLYILEYTRKTQKYKLLYVIPPIFLAWCNMHGGCVSGLGLLALYTVGEALNNRTDSTTSSNCLPNKRSYKTYLAVLIISFLFMFINPYGSDYVKYIFTAATMPRPYITEWISPFLHPVWDFMLVFKLFVFTSIVIIAKNIKLLKNDYTKLLVLIVCLFLSCRNVKSTPFFIITSTVFLYEYFESLIPKKNTKIIELALMAFFVICSAFSINSLFFLSEQPYKTVEFIKINNLTGKILAPMDMGSYIAYKLYPQNLIYMDGRYEEVYFDETKNAADDFYNAKENWDYILKDPPDFIIVPNDALVNDLLTQKPDYKIIWQDNQSCLYSHTNKLKKIYNLPLNDYYHYIKTSFEQLPDTTDY